MMKKKENSANEISQQRNLKHSPLIEQQIEKEFLNDLALQQIHIARKIISKEARAKGLSFFEFVKEEIKKLKDE